MSKRIKVAILDCNPRIVDGYLYWLRGNNQIKVIATITTGNQLKALLAQTEADVLLLEYYRQAMNAFSHIRQNFWQASLAGSYLQRPTRTFDNMITFASRTNAVEDTLSFIERSKASTLLGQLLSSDPLKQNSTSQELMDMEAEILFLQDKLRSSLDQPFPLQARSELRQIRTRLVEKTQQFEVAKARLERQSVQGPASSKAMPGHFDISIFRTMADNALGGNWVVLDYYLAGDTLITVAMGADIHEE